MHKWYSLCQRLGLTRSVRNKPRARSASIERRGRESPPEAKDERSESFARGARGFAKQNRLSSLHHEGANTIFLTNKKLSLDKRLQMIWIYLMRDVPILTCVLSLFWSTMTHKTHFLQFYGKVASHFFSCCKNKNVTLGMRLLWKYIMKIKIGIPEIGTFSATTAKLKWI